MLEAIERVLKYTDSGESSFKADRKTQDAVLRNLETLGEAAKRVDEKTRALAPEAPWREITGFRDVLAHDYLEIDLELV
ncbi:MAG: HepT-like ribonuclease domain-containing protein, partial [Solirubrobacterales bacterium]